MTQAEPLVLLVEPDENLGRVLKLTLATSGFRVLHGAGEEGALAAATSEQPDAVLLDLGHPASSGLQVLAALKKILVSNIVVLTDSTSGTEIVTCLRGGAFDFVLMPFDLDAVERSMRFATGMGPAGEPRPAIGDWNPGARPAAVSSDREAMMTYTEWQMLEVLAAEKGEPVLHGELLSRIWGRRFSEGHILLEYWATRLADSARLVDFHGVGYTLNPSPPE